MDLDLEQVVKLARIDLTPEEKERIVGANAVDILGL